MNIFENKNPQLNGPDVIKTYLKSDLVERGNAVAALEFVGSTVAVRMPIAEFAIANQPPIVYLCIGSPVASTEFDARYLIGVALAMQSVDPASVPKAENQKFHSNLNSKKKIPIIM